MTTRLMSAATAVMAFALLIAGNAWAQEFDPCAGLTGKAKGLCTAYSKGLGCSSDDPLATPEACANIATMLEEVTGSPPPSECPCDLSLDRTRSPNDGWVSPDFDCIESSDFDPLTPLGASLATLRHTDIFGSIPDEATALLFVSTQRDGFLKSFCLYKADGTDLEVVREDLPLPVSDADLTSAITKFEACKGAIGILAANVTLSSSTCSF